MLSSSHEVKAGSMWIPQSLIKLVILNKFVFDTCDVIFSASQTVLPNVMLHFVLFVISF